jgi:hypothetical protein
MSNSDELVENKLWSRDESLSKIIDLILDQNIFPEERALLILAKDKMVNEKVVPIILEKLQGNFESLKLEDHLSNSCFEFYESIPIKLEENPFSNQNSPRTYLKETAIDFFKHGGGAFRMGLDND